jgi:lantibiotic modifying enzyme
MHGHSVGGLAAAAEALYRVVGDNIDNPTWELLWGSPGTMLAALFAHEATGEARWLDLYRRNADRLIDVWDYDETRQCHLWTQDLYGHKAALYGAGHGFAGNAFALLRGLSAFSEDRRRLVTSRIATTTKRLAVVDRGLANWPVFSGSNARMLVQWCHGAPGFLMSLAGRMPKHDEELEKVLLQAGELTWRAGPLKKGACFCHGTDGSAMALLSLFARTGDQLWLDRARRLAMHAIGQSRKNLATFGRRRYTLWTGDPGLAVTLQACLDEQPHMPTLDFI